MSIFPLFLICSCASLQQGKMEDESSLKVVDVGTYTVIVPSNDEWSLSINKEKGILEIGKIKKWWTGDILGSTLIKVIKNNLLPEEKWSLAEDQIADDYRNTEEGIMKQAAQRGEYDLEEVKKTYVTIDDKKLYAMSYRVTKGSLFSGPSMAVEAILYLYFPPSFKDSHTFYVFLMSESYKRGSLVTIDLDQIQPIIKSFQLK